MRPVFGGGSGDHAAGTAPVASLELLPAGRQHVDLADRTEDGFRWPSGTCECSNEILTRLQVVAA